MSHKPDNSSSSGRERQTEAGAGGRTSPKKIAKSMKK